MRAFCDTGYRSMSTNKDKYSLYGLKRKKLELCWPWQSEMSVLRQRHGAAHRINYMAYAFLSLWIVPFGLVLVLRTIPRQLRGLRAAAGRAEKTYWILNTAGCMVTAYGALVNGLVMVNDFCGGPALLSASWPSLARLVWRSDDPIIAALLDLLAALVIGFAAICAARYFGYVDENDVWRKADWLTRGLAEMENTDTRRQ
jgi:hypothetical protein